MILAIGAPVCGALLGLIFFAGLWWTVRSALAAANPALWFTGSLLLRMSLILVGFYVIAAAGWQALALSLLGFLSARIAVTRFTRPATKAHHAP
jgi:F1F0 ATPase subunit 2